MPRKVIFDDDNPEWTAKDFRDARPPHEVLPPHIMAAFPRTRGSQRAATKIPVSIRLSPEVNALQQGDAADGGDQSEVGRH
jgi:hypothetical protein